MEEYEVEGYLDGYRKITNRIIDIFDTYLLILYPKFIKNEFFTPTWELDGNQINVSASHKTSMYSDDNAYFEIPVSLLWLQEKPYFENTLSEKKKKLEEETKRREQNQCESRLSMYQSLRKEFEGKE